MNVKFAVEKGMYSNLLQELTSGKEDVNTAVILIKMKTIEEIIAAYGDNIITIVSTRDTYDGPATTEPIEAWNDKKVEEPNIKKVITEAVASFTPEGPAVTTEEKPLLETSTKEYVESEIDTSKPLPSPKCTKCEHRMISHNKKGCRFCDCEEKRKKN